MKVKLKFIISLQFLLIYTFQEEAGEKEILK